MNWLEWGIWLLAAWVLGEASSTPLLGLLVLGAGTGVMLQRLGARQRALEAEVKRLAAGGAPKPATPLPAAAPAAVTPATQPAPMPVAAATPVPAPVPASVPAAVPKAAPAEPAVVIDERRTAITSSLGESLKAWIRGGNTIVRLGVLILFFGVAFLLRFAAEHALLPIELRLAAVAVGGLALCGVGWRVRGSRRGYGLTLQGGGIGVLYLVVFAALRLYALLPAPLAFALLLALSLLTALLAVWQDALVLAVLGFGGGFLAPVLASTGHGSHVVLFSYYLVLNLAIAWIASRQAWKLLNLVGFVFTFVIGTAWGVRSYEPSLYASTQLFLVLHFALYLFISVQYSRQLVQAQDAARLRPVDGGLLFGLPLVAFGLQAALVRHLPYGLALSSAVLSAVYLLLGRWLWRHAGARLRLLTEGLLALGLVFLVLITPLALDARWTGAAWAVQGAGVLWVALRQGRGWAAGLALLLQVLAALAFWQQPREAALPLWINAHLLGAVMLGGAALVSARLLQRAQERGAALWPDGSQRLPAEALALGHWVMLGLGVLQLLAGVWGELRWWDAPRLDEPARAALLLSLAAAALEVTQRRLAWPALGVAGRSAVAFAAWVSLAGVGRTLGEPAPTWERFTGRFGVLEMLAVLGVAVWMQRRLRADGGPWRRSLAVEHLGIGWYLLLQAALQSHAAVSVMVARHEAWTPLAFIALPSLFVWWVAGAVVRGQWPVSAHPRAWLRGLAWPWLGVLALWSLAVDVFADGGMAPLPYLPLVNPIDLGHVLALLLALRVSRAGGWAGRSLALALGGLSFVWLNAVLVRSLHHWAGTPMWTAGAWDSGPVQTGLTILWTVLALLTMLYATRRAAAGFARWLWLLGAALLGVVVLKLFFIDLSSIGTLERIISFLGVGVLMLVIGYVSPMPPAASTSRGAVA